VFLGGGGLGSDQTLSCRTIDESGVPQVCNHRVRVGDLAGADRRGQDVSGTILATGDKANLFEAGLKTRIIGDDVIHVRHVVVATNGVRPVLASHGVVVIRVHHVKTALRATDDWACLQAQQELDDTLEVGAVVG
jgi:hypothetical protein